MRVRLPEADRVRLKAPEVLEVDLTRIKLSEALAIEAATGLTPLGLLAGAVRMHPRCWLAIVWLGLSRAGVQVGIGEVELDNLLEVRVEGTEGEEDPKGSPSSTGSARTRSTGTGSRSPRAGAGRRTRQTG